jgi:hypothetical protein
MTSPTTNRAAQIKRREKNWSSHTIEIGTCEFESVRDPLWCHLLLLSLISQHDRTSSTVYFFARWQIDEYRYITFVLRIMFNLFFNKQKIELKKKKKNLFLSRDDFVCQIEHIHIIKRACQYEISYLSIYVHIYIYRKERFFFLFLY